jgi:hypothetical protein
MITLETKRMEIRTKPEKPLKTFVRIEIITHYIE